jgi:L-amino acid N-acyltransferase YncA/DNA-binding transcriptional ArsR family regulator
VANRHHAGCGVAVSAPPAAAPLSVWAAVDRPVFIAYRRLTMARAEQVERQTAEQYAAWFRALSDPTRVQIVSLLAERGEPMKVGDIVSAANVGQSTVSQHLKILADVRFVLAEQRGTARWYRLNEACVGAFPTAADLVLGRTPPQALPAAAAGAPEAGAPPGASPPGHSIRPMRPTDSSRVLSIYQAGLDTGEASFETTAPSWAAFDAAELPAHRYVAVSGTTGDVIGWVAASAVSGRCVYSGVVEHSVYVDPRARQRGVGLALLRAFIASTEAGGIWTIQSGVFPENTASLRVHQRAGFRVVGLRERLGCHHGRWRDVALLERRSRRAGVG